MKFKNNFGLANILQTSFWQISTVIQFFVLTLTLTLFFTADIGAEEKVSAVKIKAEDYQLQEEISGRVVPFEIAEIRPQVTGIINKRLFEEGAEVHEGQQLYQIDPTLYQASYNKSLADLAKAEANLKLLSSKLKKYDKLVQLDSVSKQEYEDLYAQLSQAEADVAIAKATVDTAKINLDYTQVYSPISGITSKSEITKGALVTANQANAIMRVTKLDPIYVDFNIESNKIGYSKHKLSDTEIRLILDNSSNYEHIGKLQFIDVTVEQTTGAITVRGIFPNPDKALLPGMFVRGKISFSKITAFLLPQQAVVFNYDGSANVWVIDPLSKQVHLKPISIGQNIGNKWLILSGLRAGDLVVTEGMQKLVNGKIISFNLQE